MKCLNIIVFYNNRDEVEKYITEVSTISRGQVDVVLIVNRDEYKQVPILTSDLKGKGVTCFKVVDYGENVGYLNAMLKTIKLIDMQAYSYVILSNTDICYSENNFFELLLQKEYPADVGCVAPSVYATQSNSYSNPHYMSRISRKKLECLVRIFSFPSLTKLYLKLANYKASKKKKEKSNSCYVYSPHGCYMIFLKKFIDRISGYEYGVKMYSEESCVGELLLQNNMKCFYDETIEIIHQESSITGKIDYKKRFSMWRDSIKYILNQYY